MNAHKFVAEFGIERARGVINSVPDKTATHWVFRKMPNYYSIDFKSWFHDGEWWDSDCHTEQDLIDSYGDDFVVNLEELKQVVESVEIVQRSGGFESVKAAITNYRASGDKVTFSSLEKRLADYEHVESIKKVNGFGGIGMAKLIEQSVFGESLDLSKAISDYESGGDQ